MQFIPSVVTRIFLFMHDDRFRGTEAHCGTSVTDNRKQVWTGTAPVLTREKRWRCSKSRSVR